MTRRRRIVLWTLGALSVFALLGGAALLIVLQSEWFYNRVRMELVETVEKATGGRVEIGRFHFFWRQLRAEVDNFVLHGTEPADKPPLLRAAQVAVGIRIVSWRRRDVDLESLEVLRPQVYLMVGPDGRTNVPEPKVKGKPGKGTMETILDLAIGRFDLRDGRFEVEARGSIPFEARGENLAAKFSYDRSTPRYQGEITVHPLELRHPDIAALPLEVRLLLGIERNRIQVAQGSRIGTGHSQLAFQGTVEDLANPRGNFQYDARADLADLRRTLKWPQQLTGGATVAGSAVWRGGTDFVAEGKLHGFGVEFRDPSLRIFNGQLEGAVDVNAERVHASGLRVTGTYADQTATVPGSAHIPSLVWKGKNMEARGIDAAALGGTFRGDADLRDWERYRVSGQLAGFEIKRLVSIYSQEPLPWDGLLSGQAEVAGNLKSKRSTAASARLGISPAVGGAPVRGQLAIDFDARANVLDLGRSYVELPHSRMDASGAIGKQLRVHAATRDLRDILPAVGAPSLPLTIESGAITFDGTVSGSAGEPRISGHVATGKFAYQGTALDSLQADVDLTAEGIAARNLVAARGTLRARGDGSLQLHEWKADDGSALGGTVAIRDAALADLVALAGVEDLEALGMLAATAQVSGTLGKPVVKADIQVARGSLNDEPFDRITAQASYTAQRVEVADAKVTAGTRELEIKGSYDHTAGSFASGRLRFDVSTTVMPLEEFRTLEKARPGIQGTLLATAKGTVDIVPAQPAHPRYRIAELQADVRGRGLQLTGQPLGDARLTLNSEGNVLRGRLSSDFANSRIRGEGQWKLAEDYPGEATITLTRLDFQQLRAWVAPKQKAGQFDLAGSAEGELKIEGPAGKPELLKATLRIPKVEVGPAAAGTAPAGRESLTLRNHDPIVASMVNQVVTVENARMVGRSTDLSLTGKVALLQRNPLDLRLNGRLDLAILQDFSHEVFSSGTVTADAQIRGTFQSPQINGRMELKDAATTLADFPNGLSKANGVILFNGDRATIQTLTGESGGGKISLTGFAGYGGEEMVFRIGATAEEVRVRYPEGVSTVADADLVLTGTTSRSMLSGTITVVRTGFNPQSDFSSILAKSAEPVRTPSSRTGFLGGLNFDIQIETSPDITFQSSLAEGLQVEANLRLRGTASNPALLGRVSITQGQIVFFGTKYTINQGSIAFFNPVKVEPVLNIDLETKARGVDVTLTVSGPLNKLTLTPRSDPPLQFNEIVALLATGRTPTSDPTLLSQQTNSPQSWQQMGASALLGSAIANPVAGRLQRFFGVSRLKIDPSLTGVENNPQARLTLEQQITQNITFTYITNVTSSNPLVVRVEWAFSRQWSAVAVREENGLFGLDFFYKKRFK